MNLCIEHIRKDHDGRPVLRDCSFTFRAGGVHVLMGPNGSGKSTLLRICSLLDPPDSGELSYEADGLPLPQDMALRRRMTLVLPRTGVFNTTVFKNVAYGLRVRGVSPQVTQERVRSALSTVGLEHLSRQQALTLSSGETQRLGLARALAIDPEVLFLDEPTASVDQENAAIIEAIVRRLKHDGRRLIIMTTHDREQAERMADVLLFLHQGALTRSPS